MRLFRLLMLGLASAYPLYWTAQFLLFLVPETLLGYWLGQPVQVDVRRLEELPVTIVEEDLVDVTNAHRHDPAKLAAALMRIQQQDRAERPRQRRTITRRTASVG